MCVHTTVRYVHLKPTKSGLHLVLTDEMPQQRLVTSKCILHCTDCTEVIALKVIALGPHQRQSISSCNRKSIHGGGIKLWVTHNCRSFDLCVMGSHKFYSKQ